MRPPRALFILAWLALAWNQPVCAQNPTAPSAVPALSSTAPAFWAWAPTPPLGWNSYDAWGDTVTEDQGLANAHYMHDHLLAHGWNTIVLDFRWYDPQPTGDDRKLNPTRTGAQLAVDANGRLLPAPNRFPSSVGGQGFKPLADQLHALGLKFGLHLMRGIPRQDVLANTPIAGSNFTAAQAGDSNDKCPWCPDMFGVKANPAGQAWYDAEFKLFASWGLDFVKVDDLSQPYHTDEIVMIRAAIDKSGRAIVFSTSPGPTPVAQAGNIKLLANQWRISGDFWDQWKKLNRQFDLFAQWAPTGATGLGHYADGDMIPFGRIAIKSALGGKDHVTRFTHLEQITLLSLWSLESSPLILGGNLPDNDAALDALLTNDEVLKIDQDALCSPAQRVSQQNGLEVWVKILADQSSAIGLFNRTNAPANVTLTWAEAGLSGKQHLRDLWSHTDLGAFAASYTAPVPPHGSLLLHATPAP